MNLGGGISGWQPIPERTNWVWRTSSCWPWASQVKRRGCVCVHVCMWVGDSLHGTPEEEGEAEMELW